MKALARALPSDIFDGLLNALRRTLKLIPEDRAWLRAAAVSGVARVERALARKPSPELQSVLDDLIDDRNPWGVVDYLMHEREKADDARAERCLEIMAFGLILQDPALAESAVDEVFSIAPDNAEALHWKGVIQRVNGRLEYAEALFTRAAKVADAAKDPAAKADALLNLALVHRAAGHAAKAEKAFLKGAEIKEKMGRDETLYFACVQLARHYVVEDDLKKAEKMNLRAAELAEALGRWDCVADCHYTLGLVYSMTRISAAVKPPKPGAKRARPVREAAALRKAEQEFLKSTEINARLGRAKPLLAGYNALEDLYTALGYAAEAEGARAKAESIESADADLAAAAT